MAIRNIGAMALVAAGLAVSPITASAQATSQRGSSTGEISSRLDVTSTTPRVVRCRNRTPGCLRVMFEIKPVGGQNIEVAYANPGVIGGGLMGDSSAFVATGAVCEIHALSGLPGIMNGVYRNIQWDQTTPTTVTPTKPGVLIAEIRCDQPIIAGDQMTYQITLYVRTDARTDGVARYVFSRIDVQ